MKGTDNEVVYRAYRIKLDRFICPKCNCYLSIDEPRELIEMKQKYEETIKGIIKSYEMRSNEDIDY